MQVIKDKLIVIIMFFNNIIIHNLLFKLIYTLPHIKIIFYRSRETSIFL